MNVLTEMGHHLEDKYRLFARLVSNDLAITTSQYSRSTHTQNSYVFAKSEFFRITKIIQSSGNILLLGLKYNKIAHEHNSFYVHVVQSGTTCNNLQVLKISDIQSCCFSYFHKNILYIFDLFNRHQ